MTNTHLPAIRKERGYSAAELARAVGVSRQTIYAMEDGSYTPNTTVALLLARVLQVRVEDLFSLGDAPAQQEMEVLLTEPGEPATSVKRHGRVGERLIAVRASGFPAFLPAAEQVFASAREGTLVVAGCDPALSMLTGASEDRRAKGGVLLANACSRTALRWLHEGLVHVAGLHLFDDEQQQWNKRAANQELGSDRFEMVTFAAWEQGFAFARTGSRPVRSIADLCERRIRLVNRQQGAGSRDILDAELRRSGIAAKDVRGYGNEAPSHLAAAYEVATGRAQCCIVNSAAARFYDLGFVPIRRERFDLAFRKEHAGMPELEALFDRLTRAPVRKQLADLAGYDVTETGLVQTDNRM